MDSFLLISAVCFERLTYFLKRSGLYFIVFIGVLILLLCFCDLTAWIFNMPELATATYKVQRALMKFLASCLGYVYS